ncbi:MAG: tRNA (adenosine(37)-N6)-threonylcarbamoyltransferase complex dimerization subunit type 1 TsaB [Hyphomicrobiales bacterium]
MKILSLDTTMAGCSAAIVDTDSALPLAADFAAMERGHAEALPPMVAKVVKTSGLALSEIDRIAVTTGPGTFTGVRIGLAFARGLGLARNIPVVGIDSLAAIAANETQRVHLLVASDARNDEIYAAMFDAHHRQLMPPHVTTAAAAAADVPSETLVLGTAAQAVIAGSRRNDLALSLAGDMPVAAHFARLAAIVTPAEMPLPLYLRAPDAKPQASALRKIGLLSIEDMGPAAAELMAELHGEIFEEGWTRLAFTEMLLTPGTDAAIARQSDEPLGLIVTRRAMDEAEIITIGTRPSAQRRGVARQLLAQHMVALTEKGVRHLFLEVAASNAAALRLYVAMGFAEAGRRKGYYRSRGRDEDAIVMRREITP